MCRIYLTLKVSLSAKCLREIQKNHVSFLKSSGMNYVFKKAVEGSAIT